MREKHYQRWLSLVAEILNEHNPQTAQELLVTGLLQTFNAYTGARIQWTHDSTEQPVVFSAISLTEDINWSTALNYSTEFHPLLHFHAQTNNYQPHVLKKVVEAGWHMTPQANELFASLGLSEHQLSIPMKTQSHVTLYGLISEEAFDEHHVALATTLQPILAALDKRIRLIEQFREQTETKTLTDVELTAREALILRMIADGSTVAGMAARLSVSPRTVHKHQEHLYRKLGAKDRLSAVLRAQQTGHLKRHKTE